MRLRQRAAARRLRRVHVHEPIAPMVGWDACCFDGAPVVGTFHAYSAKWLPNAIARGVGARRVFNRLHARIAVSEAARWTGERYFGGHYEVIPNGVDLDARADAARSRPSTRCGSCSSAARRSARACRCCCRRSPACASTSPCGSTSSGAGHEGVEPLLAEVEGGMEGIEVHGRVDDEELWRRLHERRRAVRALARRRELRHGPDGGIRGRHAGRRLRHRRLPPGRDARPRRAARAARPARSSWPRRCASLWLDPARRQTMGGPPRGRAAGLRLAARRRAGEPASTSARSRRRRRDRAARRARVTRGPAPGRT